MLATTLRRPAIVLLALALTACASDTAQKKSAPQASGMKLDARAKTASFDGAWSHLDRGGLVTCTAHDPDTPERVVDAFRRAGLQGAFGDDQYRRDLGVRTALLSAGVTLDSRQVARGGGSIALPSSGAGDVTGPLVFAGYGIVAEERQRDDYAGIDPKGAIVVLFTGRPDDVVRSGAFQEPDLARFGHERFKIETAAARGAAGVIFVAAPGGYDAEAGVLPEPQAASRWRASIPAVQVQTKLVQKALSPAGVSLEQLKKLLARDGTAAVATKVSARLAVDELPRSMPGWAVVGVARGTGGGDGHVLVHGACDDDPRWAHFRGAPRSTAAAAVFLGEMIARQPLDQTVLVAVTGAGGDAGRLAVSTAAPTPPNRTSVVLDVSGVRGREGPLFATASAGAGAGASWSRTIAMLPPGSGAPAAYGNRAVVDVRTAAGAPDSDDLGPALTQLLLDLAATGPVEGTGGGDAGPLGLRLLPAPPPFSGALVDAVERDAPADVGGLRPGDLITAVGGQETRSLGAVLSALGGAKGDLKVRVTRRGDLHDLLVPAASGRSR
jgi:hypothetical protein